MISETIRKIESKLNSAKGVGDAKKEELKSLLAELKGEIESLSEADPDRAHSITGFTEVSAHEATRSEKNPQSLQHGLDGLKSSVIGFEKSHPGLVNAVNRICQTLSNFGI